MLNSNPIAKTSEKANFTKKFDQASYSDEYHYDGTEPEDHNRTMCQ